MKKRPNLPNDAEGLIDSFLDNWEANWPEASNYSPLEMAVIKSFITKKVASNYLSTGQIVFTKAELASATNYLITLDNKKVKKPKQTLGLNSQCLDFVNLWLSQWDMANSFNRDEIALIRTKLYSKVADNYTRTHNTQLAFTKNDLRDSLAFVDSIRHRRGVEAHADHRDQNIRKARSQFGLMALPYSIGQL